MCPSIIVLISDLNVLIMNYLVHQGYPSAAVSFAREANLALSKESVESITARMEVRNKIHAGDIEGALGRCSDDVDFFANAPVDILPAISRAPYMTSTV